MPRPPRTGALLLRQVERLFSSRETPNCHSYLKQDAYVAVPLTPPPPAPFATSLPSPPRNNNHVLAKPDSGPNYLSPIPSFSKLSYYSIKVRTNPLCDSDSNSDSRVQTISPGGPDTAQPIPSMTAHVLTFYKYKLARKKIKLKYGLREERLVMDKHSIRDITYQCFLFFLVGAEGRGFVLFLFELEPKNKKEKTWREEKLTKKKRKKKLYCIPVLFYIDFRKNNRDRSEGC